MIDDRQTAVENRDKALKLIEAWGESTEELRYLPIFEETLKVRNMLSGFTLCWPHFIGKQSTGTRYRTFVIPADP
jgi:hypothetical protein